MEELTSEKTDLVEVEWTCPNCGHKQMVKVITPLPEAVSMVCDECGKRGTCEIVKEES